MKKLFFTITVIFSFVICYGQRLTQITLTNGNSDIITFITEDAVIINITTDGKIIDWGVAYNGSRFNNYPGRLEKYMGRTVYYTENDNEAWRGKVKYIGRTAFTYYSSYENELFKGKVKGIGTTLVDYYNSYDDAVFKGRIKNAGLISFSYYSSFENEAYKGKFKNVGTSVLTYYSSYDDKAYKGKIKSIDSHIFSYYSSFDRPEYRGAMKGFQMEYFINGIKYLLK
ncbi:MAG: hypothetical protein ABI707_11470 [Ferruginibacter sp.]